MAAVLACGEGAVLSHHSAAALWKLLKPIDGAIHVSIPTTSGRATRRGIHLHLHRSLSPPREPSPSPSYLHREGGRGRRLLTTHRHNIPVTTIQRTIDDPEEDFFALVRRHSLPLPETTVKLGRHEVDFLWREKRLIVETDSYLYHRGSIAFEDAYVRDLDLRSAGYTVLRFVDVQIEDEPERVAADVVVALRREPLFAGAG